MKMAELLWSAPGDT